MKIIKAVTLKLQNNQYNTINDNCGDSNNNKNENSNNSNNDNMGNNNNDNIYHKGENSDVDHNNIKIFPKKIRKCEITHFITVFPSILFYYIISVIGSRANNSSD